MIFNEYISYARDNPKRYWFKAKWYGWGWVPVTWEGWVVVAVFVLILLANGLRLDAAATDAREPASTDLMLFFGTLTISVVALLWICMKTGEKPRWNWGDPRKRK